MTRIQGGILLAFLALALACAGSQEEAEVIEETPSMTGGFDSGMMDDGMDSGEMGGGEAVAELEPVYFDYDRAMVRDDQKPTLRSNSKVISGNSDWRTVVIEGHTDERGSEEYNLSLGERRANAVKQYLVNLGVSGARLDTVSFGETKPAVQGHDESAWRWNRRSEFRVVR